MSIGLMWLGDIFHTSPIQHTLALVGSHHAQSIIPIFWG